MEYTEEKKKLIDYVTKNGMIIELAPDRKNEKQYYQELETFDNGKKLAIRYPGYKTTKKKCDYCVYLVDEYGEKPISHEEIMIDLYEKTTAQNYQMMRQYVEEVAMHGKNIEISAFLQNAYNSGFSFEELTSLMFYIAIQEDINYPEKRYQGRKMCFYRYLEAVYCKMHDNHSFDEALKKATAKGYIPSKWNDVGDLYNVVSAITRE